MHLSLGLLSLAALAPTHVLSQTIWDVFQTTLDQTMKFTNNAPSPAINFFTPGTAQTININVNDATKYQNMSGFGGTLTDSSATVLANLKSTNVGNYNTIMNLMFSTSTNSAGLNYIRVPIGASDFSASAYTLDSAVGSVTVDMSKVPAAVMTVLNDIKALNPFMKVHLVPWSPPAWMKSSGTINGGSLNSAYMNSYPVYLLHAIQGFIAAGIPVDAISVQNEPLNDNPTYPTCSMTASVEAQLATCLRTLLVAYGLTNIKIVGAENNWNDATGYDSTLMTAAPNVFAGAAFHCYGGTVADQDSFHTAYPTKDVYFTECTGMNGGDWTSGITWSSDNLWIGAPERWSKTGLMFNIALDYSGLPKFPGTNSCASPGCRGMVSVASGGTYTLNPEFYAMAQASKASIPQDSGGPFGQRIAVSVTGGGSLHVVAYETRRTNPTDWNRYNIVVLNSGSATTTSIQFRGAKATFSFPPGVTTLWWWAPKI